MADEPTKKASPLLLVGVVGLVLILLMSKPSSSSAQQDPTQQQQAPNEAPVAATSSSGVWDCYIVMAGGSFASGYSALQTTHCQLHLAPNSYPPPWSFLSAWFHALKLDEMVGADFAEVYARSPEGQTASAIIQRDGPSWTPHLNLAGQNYTYGTHGVPATVTMPGDWVGPAQVTIATQTESVELPPWSPGGGQTLSSSAVVLTDPSGAVIPQDAHEGGDL